MELSWRSLVRRLKREVPLKLFTVSICRRRRKGMLGWTVIHGDMLQVFIDPDLEWGVAVDTLAHEYAHCIAIDEAYQHGDYWGQKYSASYRAVMGICNGDAWNEHVPQPPGTK